MALIVRFRHPDRGTPTYGTADGGEVTEIEPHPFVAHRPTGERLALDDVRLLAPVLPSKVICVGRNYVDHAAELGGEVPDEPLLFLKPSTTVIGPYQPIRYPTGLTEEVHYEGELAVVVGRLMSQVSPADAAAGVYGFMCANDITARDIQRRESQWTRAKGFDTFCPLGPAISTDVDPSGLRLRTVVDGDLRQDGSTADMVFDVGQLVSYASQVMTLLPGDVLLTGTPAGVGPLTVGQTVTVEVDGIGRLENPVEER